MSLSFPAFEIKSVSELQKLSNEEVANYKQAQQDYFENNFKLMQEHAEKQGKEVDDLSAKAKKANEIILAQGEEITALKKVGAAGPNAKKSLKVEFKKVWAVSRLMQQKFLLQTQEITLENVLMEFQKSL